MKPLDTEADQKLDDLYQEMVSNKKVNSSIGTNKPKNFESTTSPSKIPSGEIETPTKIPSATPKKLELKAPGKVPKETDGAEEKKGNWRTEREKFIQAIRLGK